MLTKSVGASLICETVKNLQKLHTQRIKGSFFSDGETMQLKTVELTREITGLIKESDLKLKELSRAETSESSSEQSKCPLPATCKKMTKLTSVIGLI